ncbi:MAG: superoxide dismutase [Epsilonproteobacteria bacterium]|nr:superoxide dismutase [Campylobacterota bacterium]
MCGGCPVKKCWTKWSCKTCFKKQHFSDYKYPYSLPQLDYAYDTLEPHLDAPTMELHHTKHHQAYVSNLNKALEPHTEYHGKTLEELLSSLGGMPEELASKVRDHGGGHFNHSLFWKVMSPNGGGQPSGELASKIDKDLGSFDALKESFNKAAQSRFGSGWAWLCVDSNGKLVVSSTGNQDATFEDGLFPIMGLDVWEHAYYLKYQNKRPDYITAWWSVIDWKQVEKNYELAKEACGCK